MYHGGFAEVRMGNYQGHDVAVKVLRVSLKSLPRITRVSHERDLQNHQLRTNHVPPEVLQGSHDLEGAPPPERASAVGGDNVQEPARNGVKVDGQWEHQRVH